LTAVKTTIWYSVLNCGDGSAVPVFFFERVCAEIHQDLQPEGWGEPCVSGLEIVHQPGPVVIKGCLTREEYIKELNEDLVYEQGRPRGLRISEALEKLTR
jgi:hypothetical protein